MNLFHFFLDLFFYLVILLNDFFDLLIVWELVIGKFFGEGLNFPSQWIASLFNLFVLFILDFKFILKIFYGLVQVFQSRIVLSFQIKSKYSTDFNLKEIISTRDGFVLFLKDSFFEVFESNVRNWSSLGWIEFPLDEGSDRDLVIIRLESEL